MRSARNCRIETYCVVDCCLWIDKLSPPNSLTRFNHRRWKRKQSPAGPTSTAKRHLGASIYQSCFTRDLILTAVSGSQALLNEYLIATSTNMPSVCGGPHLVQR